MHAHTLEQGLATPFYLKTKVIVQTELEGLLMLLKEDY